MARTNKYIYQLYKDNKLVFEGSALDISLKYYTVPNTVYGCIHTGRLFLCEYDIKKRLNPKYHYTKLTPMKPIKKNNKYYCANCGGEVSIKWKCCPKCEWRLEK